jgi:hypothetical protein
MSSVDQLLVVGEVGGKERRHGMDEYRISRNGRSQLRDPHKLITG